MTTKELENKIKELIDFVEKLPEKYREKCFEVLLANYLTRETSEKIEQKAKVPPPFRFQIPIDVKAFLQQYNIPEELLKKMFLIEGEEIRPIYKIKTSKKSEGQIQIALLTALENALRPNGKFEFSMEAVRDKCKEHGVYDAPNFQKYFKKRLFKGLGDKEHIELSPDGKAELAEVILEITK